MWTQARLRGAGERGSGGRARLCLHAPGQAVKEILDTWENMKFSVVKYYKGTHERGYILGSVDEVVQSLDDNTVNLQSISGSRFVGPFLQTVHKWEKSLSLIGEVIEVRPRRGSGGLLEHGPEGSMPSVLACLGRGGA